MASVWYVGSSGSRSITAEEWAGIGAPGNSTVWNVQNGYSVSQGGLTAAQILVLRGDSGFWVDAPDTVRKWSQVPGGIYAGNPSTGGTGETAVAQMLDILAQGQGAANAAATSQANAQGSANAAAVSANAAYELTVASQAAKTAAEAARDTATASKNTAGGSATAAANSATAAATSATNAGTSATNAATSATASDTARAASVTAKTAAETAKTASQTAQTASETAKTASESARTTTQGYRDTTLGYRNEAEAFKNQASQAATGAIPDGSLALVKFAAAVQTSLGKADSAVQPAGLGSYQLTSQKGAANGYVPLDGSVKIAATYLPSYVDDVLEFSNLAGFPGTGETGKIYTALDTGRIYRWSGSVYVRIAPSPGSTDEVPEGTNLYFTGARAISAVTGNAGYMQGQRNGTPITTKTDVLTESQYQALVTAGTVDANTIYLTT